jgi:hypothetical protein
VGKGTTVERLKIIQRSVNFKAGNLLSGPEIPSLGPEFPPLDKISGEFPALRNSAKSFTKRCGATLYKGAENSGLAEFPGAGNSAKSFTKGCGAAFWKGPEILRN